MSLYFQLPVVRDTRRSIEFRNLAGKHARCKASIIRDKRVLLLASFCVRLFKWLQKRGFGALNIINESERSANFFYICNDVSF